MLTFWCKHLPLPLHRVYKHTAHPTTITSYPPTFPRSSVCAGWKESRRRGGGGWVGGGTSVAISRKTFISGRIRSRLSWGSASACCTWQARSLSLPYLSAPSMGKCFGIYFVRSVAWLVIAFLCTHAHVKLVGKQAQLIFIYTWCSEKYEREEFSLCVCVVMCMWLLSNVIVKTFFLMFGQEIKSSKPTDKVRKK